MNFNIKLFLPILIVFIILYNYFNYQVEYFHNYFHVNDFDNYNNHVYPLTKNITKQENAFIKKWIGMLEERDISKFDHISTYMIGYTIFKNGHINKSRFGIGTLTKHQEFKNDCLKILRKYNIEFKEPHGYLWYALAWDIEDKILKVYLLNKRKTKIISHIYSVSRHKNEISEIYFSSKKYYNVNKNKTLMFKDQQTISQVNVDVLPKYLKNRYPKSKEIISFMNEGKWDLNTYSEYNGKLNLYFD